MLPCILRCAAYVYTRLQVRKSGRTPCTELAMKRFQAPLMEFGEVALTREPGERNHELAI